MDSRVQNMFTYPPFPLATVFGIISVVKESLTTVADRNKYKTQLYNLDVIISVGYSVKSMRGIQFRQ